MSSHNTRLLLGALSPVQLSIIYSSELMLRRQGTKPHATWEYDVVLVVGSLTWGMVNLLLKGGQMPTGWHGIPLSSVWLSQFSS